MTRFIKQSACGGERPYGVAPDRLVSRPRLLSRLLSNRDALRLVVAPPGFGKATLAYEYASVMFQLEHVFWVHGSSPCFLRDLDAGVLAEAVLESDSNASLMVVANLPFLDEKRIRAFAETVNQLGERGCEVIATTTRGDMEVGQLGEVVSVGAEEMLVRWEDIEEERGEPRKRRILGMGERIPSIRWGAATAARVVLDASREGLTNVEELALWAMTVLERGTLADLQALLGAKHAAKAWRILAERCPFLGISVDEDHFVALSMPLEEVRTLARSRLQLLSEACGIASREKTVEILAQRLMARGECARAVQAVALLCRRSIHASWLAKNGWEALWGRAAVEVCDLYESATRTQVGNRADLNAMIAWAWAQQDERARAIRFARRSLSSDAVSPKAALAAALVAWDVGNAAARRAMEEFVSSGIAALETPGDTDKIEATALVAVARVVLAATRGEDSLAAWAVGASDLESWVKESCIELECRLLGAAVTFETLEERGAFADAADIAAIGCPGLVRLVAYSHRALDALVERGWGLGFGAFRAATALDRAASVLDGLGLPRLSDLVTSALYAAHVERGGQRRRSGERPSANTVVSESDVADEFAVRTPVLSAPLDEGRDSVEPLRLKLFGSMEVALGRRDITHFFEGRPKTRLLLALLALHRGRELGREQLVSMLWPAAAPRTGAKSFYRVWSDLRAVLSQNGSCPYLIRNRYGCRLDPDLLESDLDKFDALVRSLLLGLRDEVAWERAIVTIQGSFGGTLLPSELKNDVIAVFRDRFESELVDGLIAASRRLLSQGEFQGALWFAREAFRRDAGREDAAAVLMRTQMATDQRSAAVQTFFSCRDHLGKTLGLDPSPTLMTLYQQLLEGQVAWPQEKLSDRKEKGKLIQR